MFYENRFGERLYQHELDGLTRRLETLRETRRKKLLSVLGYSRTMPRSHTGLRDAVLELFRGNHVDSMYREIQEAEDKYKSAMTRTTETNEFGEIVKRSELKKIAKRIIALPDDMIDELWFRIGFIYAERGTNKAVPDRFIKRIKESMEEAESALDALFTESRIELIRKELCAVEKMAMSSGKHR